MRRFIPCRTKTLALILGLLGLLAVACGSAATATPRPTPTPTPTPAPPPTATLAPTAAPTPTAEPVASTGSGIRGGDPEFDLAAMVWQGYWLSRDQFGPFVMASGMGIPFAPPMDKLAMAMQMVAQNPDDPVMVPQNMMPLQAVFAEASPDLVNDPRDFDAMDFEAFRLDPDNFDKTVSVRGQAETMLKESQWAHNFADAHFGEPGGDFGAQQRFMGVMVSMLAQMQGQYAMQNLMGEDGLYHDSDGYLDFAGNWVMLHALADIAGLTGEEGGRYANPEVHPMFDNAATQLFRALEARQPESPQEAAAAIRSLAYLAYLAWTTGDDSIREAALGRVEAIADGSLLRLSSADVVENAAAIAGLTAAADAFSDALNQGRYLNSAKTLFQSLVADFDASYGVFKSRTVYNVDDVAWIIGGLNFLAQQGDDPTRAAAFKMLLAFYESTIGLAGMQLSAPPGKNGAMAGPWEQNLPSVLYYHPADTPPPPMAGKLTVPAEEITWDGSAWTVTSDRFVPAGAMHLANELNWLGPHLGSVPFSPLRD